MDSITHTIVGVSFASAVLGRTKHGENTAKLFIAATLVANFPDIDIVLTFISRHLYMLEHRGFTHSLIGSFVMVPVGAYILRIFLKNLDVFLALKTSCLIFFSHVLLDFLTIYGVQIFYPFSRVHYDYSIIFIIDPIVWVVGFIYLGFYFASKVKRVLYSKMFIGFLGILFSLYLYVRVSTVEQFHLQYPSARQIKYTPILSPFIGRNVFAKTNRGYVQNLLTLDTIFSTLKFRYTESYPYMPPQWTQEALPPNGIYSAKSQNLFKQYQKIMSPMVCKGVKGGATCISLKYRYPSIENTDIFYGKNSFLKPYIPFQ